MDKHTPGRWITEEHTFAERTGALLSIYVAQEYDHPKEGKVPGGRICEVFANCLADDKACEANARLIAAAPDLLAALRELVAVQYDGDPMRQDDPLIVRANAAIAKAEGR